MTTTSTSKYPLPKVPREQRKKKRVKLRFKRKKKMTGDDPPATENSPLIVIHATSYHQTIAEAKLERAKTLLYVSHFVAKFSELGWQFCLILFLTALTNYQSLILVSTYGLFTGTVSCICGPSAGAFIDSKDRERLHIAQLFIWVQNLSVIVATTCCFFLLRLVVVTIPAANDGSSVNAEGLNATVSQPADVSSTQIDSDFLPDLAPPATYTTWWLLAAVHIFGAVGKLTDQSMTVAMERDWIVVMSKVAGGGGGNDSDDDDYDSEQSKDDCYLLNASTSQDSDLSSISMGEASLGSHTAELNGDILRQLKEKTWLTNTNTVMKQIDLLCKVAAPAAAGMFFAYFDNYVPGTKDVTLESGHWDKLSYAALIIGILNLISLLVEYHLIQQIYELVPQLAVRSNSNESSDKDKCVPKLVSQKDNKGGIQANVNNDGASKLIPMRGKLSTIESGIVKLPSSVAGWDAHSVLSADEESSFISRFRACCLPWGLDIYLREPVFFGGFALSLLYLNILSFGAIMTAYLVWRGMSYESIGILRGVSSIIGLLGTVAYHISSKRYSLSYTGSWSILFQFSCLSICFASLYVADDALSLFMLIVGVIVSRIGLYVFDLSITQFMQLLIPEDIRGVTGGVQKSLNGFFDLTTYGLGLIFSNPDEFYILVATGYVSVGLAMCIYFWGIHHYKDALKGV